MIVWMLACAGEPKENGGWPIDTAPAGETAVDTAGSDDSDPTDSDTLDSEPGGSDSDSEPVDDTGEPAATSDLFTGGWSLYAASNRIDGEADTHLGQRLAAGDFDGDGADALLVAAPQDPICGQGCGRIWRLEAPHLVDSLADADLARSANASGHRLGGRLEVLDDLTGDGVPDIAVGAIHANAGAGFGSSEMSGGVYLLDGTAAGTGDVTASFATVAGDATEMWVRASGSGDLDGDGSTDFAVGSHGGSGASGEVNVFTSALSGVTSVADASLTIRGNSDLARAGWSLDIGDVTGDGQDDLLIGGTEHVLDGGTKCGGAWLVHGPVAISTLDDADLDLQADEDLEFAGLEIAITDDLDGDGGADLIVGSPQYGTAAEGAVYVIAGTTTGVGRLVDAGAIVTGNEGDRVGVSLASADFDQDGQADLVVGGDGNDFAGRDAGMAALLAGPLSGSVSVDDAVATWWGENPDDQAATHLVPGDFDGDGLWDLAVGADGSSSGAAYVLLGGAR